GQHEGVDAVAGNDHRVFNLKTAEAELAIGCLDADHHAFLEDGIVVRGDVRRIIAIEADTMADMAAVIMRDTFLADRLDTSVEHVGNADAGLDHFDGAVETDTDGAM